MHSKTALTKYGPGYILFGFTFRINKNQNFQEKFVKRTALQRTSIRVLSLFYYYHDFSLIEFFFILYLMLLKLVPLSKINKDQHFFFQLKSFCFFTVISLVKNY